MDKQIIDLIEVTRQQVLIEAERLELQKKDAELRRQRAEYELRRAQALEGLLIKVDEIRTEMVHELGPAVKHGNTMLMILTELIRILASRLLVSQDALNDSKTLQDLINRLEKESGISINISGDVDSVRGK